MKSILLFTLLMIGGLLSSQSNLDYLTLLLSQEDRLTENVQDEIRALSLNLSLDEKDKLYKDYKRGSIGFSLLNILPFGYGSLIQGDVVSSTIIASADSLTIFGGLLLIMGADDMDDPDKYKKNVALTGISILLASRIFGIIAPIKYSFVYNRNLEKSLYPKVEVGYLKSTKLFIGGEIRL